MKYKLGIDDSEALEELLTSHGWVPLLKVVTMLVQEQEQNVIRYNLKDGPDGLVIEKARTEGAHALKRRLIDLKDEVLKRKTKA